MIGQLKGLLVDKQPPDIVIDCNGVGYEVQVPMTTLYALPELNEPTLLYTHFVVREDAQLLYGFATKVDRKLFRLLIKASGVGPKLALAILSGMSAEQFVSCVAHDDASTIVKIPGIGKKTAERLLIEMRDRIKDWQVESHASMPDAMPLELAAENTFIKSDAKGDALNALISLGYTQGQADKAIKAVYHKDKSSEVLIKDALKAMF
ncbi:MAG: Holliday junction branch migration protein RuvA [Thalassotalea sp.]|nr:Holliday junction branch migration protein RuvA [Thalassotalea sp.]